jgi:hypothetical protein
LEIYYGRLSLIKSVGKGNNLKEEKADVQVHSVMQVVV